MTIPIQNLYYLLSYAWDALDELDPVEVGAVNAQTPADLLASMLHASTVRLIKRGLTRGYVEYTETVPGIRGRLALSESVATLALPRGRAVCRLEDLEHDVLLNRIIKSSIRRLIGCAGLDPILHDRLVGLYRHMPSVTEIRLSGSDFARVRLHSNNRAYRLPIEICRLLHDRLAPEERGRGFRFQDFTRKQLERLFEQFLYGFFRREAPEWLTRRERTVRWQRVNADDDSLSAMSSMRIDLELTKPDATLLIEAKYYESPLIESYGK